VQINNSQAKIRVAKVIGATSNEGFLDC